MSGELVGDALEVALKEDEKAKAMLKPEPSSGFTPHGSTASSGMAGFVEAPPQSKSMDLPEGIKMAMWVPIAQADGSTLFQCSLEGFGVRATGHVGGSKQRATAYALQAMADRLLEQEP